MPVNLWGDKDGNVIEAGSRDAAAGDVRVVGESDVEKFDGLEWRRWCPCMDSGGIYCGWN